MMQTKWYVHRARDQEQTPIDGRFFDNILEAALFGYDVKARHHKWGLLVNQKLVDVKE